MDWTPKRMFLTKGFGCHRSRPQSFEMALRRAGIEKYNLVLVSSIFPPGCQMVSREQGLEALHPGQICFLVLARQGTNEPDRLVSAAVGLARPTDASQYGYISEHHGCGQTTRAASESAEDLAVAMLASSQGIELDPVQNSRDREQGGEAGRAFASHSIAQSARGHEDGLWTTVIAAAVMLIG